MTNDKHPNPGSDEALDAGCTCPVLDNGHGNGVLGDGAKYGWWLSSDCPLHGNDIPTMEPEDSEP